MQHLVRFFVERPLMSNILLVGFIAVAFNTLRNIQKEGFPEVSFNTVSIQTVHPGASALDVEINVTVPIEEALEGVAGISEVSSVSRESLSTVTAKADDDANPEDFERIFNDIKQAVDGIDDLPADVDGRPVLRQIRSQDMAVVEIGISGPQTNLRPYVDRLETSVQRLPDVSQVHRLGLPDEEVRILINLEKARALQVDLRTISHAIQTRHTEGTAGSLESYDNEKKVVIYNKVDAADEILDTILRMSPAGRGVTLRQIAHLERVPKETNLIVRSNGQRGVSLLVVKKADSDIIETIDSVREVLAGISAPPGVSSVLMNDKSAFTRNRLGLLGSNAIMGFLLVVVLLWLVFGRKTAMWTAFGIPFSLLGAIMMLPHLGATFNALSIGGFVLVLGMLVDDAIVVAEQISKGMEEGMSPQEAAVAGVVGIWKPVLASALTTVIAFSPLTQMGGMPGKFIWIIPTIVMVALVFSLIESYFFLPTHLSHGKPVRARKPGFVLGLERLYERTLRRALRLRYLVLVGFVGLLAGALFTAATVLPKDPFPQDGAEVFTVELDLPAGSSLAKTEDAISKVEQVLAGLPQHEMVGFSTRVGTQDANQRMDRGTLENRAVVQVFLTPFASRERSASTIISSLRAPLHKAVDGLAVLRTELVRLGPPIGKAFEVEISGNDDPSRRAKVEEIKAWLGEQPGVTDIGDDVIIGKREVRIQLKEDLIAQTGLSAQEIIATFRIALDGLIVTKTVDVQGSTDYRLRLAGDARTSVEELRRIQIRNSRGRLINLGRLVAFEEHDAVGERQHLNGERTNRVYGGLDKKVVTAEQMAQKIEASFPSDSMVTIRMAGESKDNAEIFGDLLVAALLALLGTYLVIAVILNSLSKPLIVMSVVPFGAVGIIATLLSHGLAISMFAMISMIGMTGIIVNASILMLYTIDALAKTSFEDALIAGSVSRLRPILLTTLTTCLGLIPTAYGFGGYDPFISPMCLTMAYGLLFGTLILLFLVPLLYMLRRDLIALGQRVLKPAAGAALAIAVVGVGAADKGRADAKTLKLGDIKALVEEHPSLLQKAEAIRERRFELERLDGAFDSRIHLKPSISYQESEPEFTSGLTGEQKLLSNAAEAAIQKMLGNGMQLRGSMKLQDLHLEPGEAAQAGPTAPPVPAEIERRNVEMGVQLSIPLGKNAGNELHHSQERMSRTAIALAADERDLNRAQLQLAVVRKYWQAWLRWKQQSVAKSSLVRARQAHAANKRKLELGLISESEHIHSELNVLAKQDELDRSAHEWKQALIGIRKVTGGVAFSGIEVIDGAFVMRGDMFDTDFRTTQHPGLALLTDRERLVVLRQQTARLQGKDLVSLDIAAHTLGSSDGWGDAGQKSAQFDKPTLMVGLSWTFMPKDSANASDLKKAASQRTQIELERRHLLSTLEATAADTRAKLHMYAKLLQNLTSIRRKRDQLAARQEVEFNQGTITTSEYLQSQDLAQATSVQRAAVIANRHLVAAQWLAEVGRLADYFELAR